MKKKSILFMLFTFLCSPLYIHADELEEDWVYVEDIFVYDKTHTVKKETIEYIEDLNHGKLKEYEYAVYVTDVLYDDLDTFKDEVFKNHEIGSKNDSGIILVTTEDGNYGIKTGNSLSKRVKDELEKDFISDAAKRRLEAKEWDRAVNLITQDIVQIVENKGILGDVPFTNHFKEAVATSSKFFIFIIVIGTATGIILVKHGRKSDTQKRHEDFFNGDLFFNYLIINKLNKEKTKEEFKGFKKSEKGIYSHSLKAIHENISKKYKRSIDNDYLRLLFPYSRFEFDNYLIDIDDISDEIHERYCIIKKHEEELRGKNENWINDYINKNYNLDIVNRVKVKLSDRRNLNVDYDELIKWFEKCYRTIEIEEAISELFTDLNIMVKKDLLSALKNTKEYNNYITGKHYKLEPSEATKKTKFYDVHSGLTEDHPWYWLYLYGLNYVEISETKKIKTRKINQKKYIIKKGKKKTEGFEDTQI